MSAKQIAIIPARGGSKRIPRKNIVDFRGKPMIVHTINAALATGLFTHVIVSTDSEEIAEISRQANAEVPFLRKCANDDFTPVSEATLAALEQAENYFNEKYDNVVQLMANCPLRNAECISELFKKHCQSNNEFSLSCFKFGWMNPWWALKVDKNGNGEKLWDGTFIRSQDLPDLFCPTGAVWIAKTESLKRDKSFYGQGHKFLEISWQQAVDIDCDEDMIFASCVADFIEKIKN